MKYEFANLCENHLFCSASLSWIYASPLFILKIGIERISLKGFRNLLYSSILPPFSSILPLFTYILSPFYLHFTTILSQFYLHFTSTLPQFYLDFSSISPHQFYFPFTPYLPQICNDIMKLKFFPSCWVTWAHLDQ